MPVEEKKTSPALKSQSAGATTQTAEKSKLQNANEAVHEVKEIVETVKSIHETLGKPLAKGLGFLSSKIGKKMTIRLLKKMVLFLKNLLSRKKKMLIMV